MCNISILQEILSHRMAQLSLKAPPGQECTEVIHAAHTGTVKPWHRPASQEGGGGEGRIKQRYGRKITSSWPSRFPTLTNQKYFYFSQLCSYSHTHLQYSNGIFKMNYQQSEICLGLPQHNSCESNQEVKFKVPQMKGNREILGHCQNSRPGFKYYNVRE